MAALLFPFFSATAGVVQISSDAPDITPGDIAMLDLTGTTAASEGHSTDIWSNRPAQGQSFLTGSDAEGYLLSGVTLRTDRNNSGNSIVVRIGELSGTDFTELRNESGVSPASAGGDYITFRFDTPVGLDANTQYGFDWGTPLTDGFTPYYTTDTTAFADGSSYSSGSGGTGVGTVTYRDSDKVFHLDIAAIPEPSSLFLLSGVLLATLAGRRKLRG